MEVVKQRHVHAEYAALQRISANIDLLLPNPNFVEIKKKLEEALQLTTQYNMLPYIAHCHVSLATLYHKMNDVEKRQAELKAAVAAFEKLGMTYWANRTNQLE